MTNMKRVPKSIQRAFDREGLNIVDDGQVEELSRWQKLDFTPREPDTYKSDSEIIIVSGCGRSGTTLTRVLLDTHSKIYAGPEALVFLPTDIDVDDLSYKFEMDRKDVQGLLDGSASRSQFIDQFQQAVLQREGKEVFTDKTARNIHCLPYISEHFPNAKFIHVVRDPRDVVASLRTHKKRKKTEDGEIKNTGYQMPLSLSVKRWVDVMKDALPQRQNLQNYMEVKYEDLILDTEATLRKVCTFLGQDFEPGMMQFHEVQGGTRDYNKFIQNIEATKPISESSIGRYKREMTADEIKKVERAVAPYAQALGYEIGSKRGSARRPK